MAIRHTSYPGPSEQTLRERLATLEKRETAVAKVIPQLRAIRRLAEAALTPGTEEADNPMAAMRSISYLAGDAAGTEA